jgi:hypothetical protein
MDILKVRDVMVDELRGLRLFRGRCEGVTPEMLSTQRKLCKREKSASFGPSIVSV